MTKSGNISIYESTYIDIRLVHLSSILGCTHSILSHSNKGSSGQDTLQNDIIGEINNLTYFIETFYKFINLILFNSIKSLLTVAYSDSIQEISLCTLITLSCIVAK